MILLPFLCLGIGIFLGIYVKDNRLAIYSEKISTVALSLLIFTIGIGIGVDSSILENFLKIGLNCIIISSFAIGFSVIFTVICEKTVLPLEKIDILSKVKDFNSDSNLQKKENGLVWIMPLSLVGGIGIGMLGQNYIDPLFIEMMFTSFLIILYICVGISQGVEKEIFSFINILGIKIIWLSIAITAGSIMGGIIAGKILNLPLNVSVISASGMSYYSLTGAFMVKMYGLEVGTYGFIVNIMRELLTIIFMPFLIKISIGSPIAGGAAGNMDAMLIPVTKFVGPRLGLVTLITGTILTFIIPFLLPLLSSVL
ncbi:lysine exporter LysO family protein [uncultured Cetobacterium sp.]|uniref:lysine exporter LysO family protein n=1 Tax=uncultured Cetobacterium sp. TaxID=527638 RepID=UPI0026238CB6|nr:lysine exporter LysO family protein [uncultured Cetobacterium sp.]